MRWVTPRHAPPRSTQTRPLLCRNIRTEAALSSYSNAHSGSCRKEVLTPLRGRFLCGLTEVADIPFQGQFRYQIWTFDNSCSLLVGSERSGSCHAMPLQDKCTKPAPAVARKDNTHTQSCRGRTQPRQTSYHTGIKVDVCSPLMRGPASGMFSVLVLESAFIVPGMCRAAFFQVELQSVRRLLCIIQLEANPVLFSSILNYTTQDSRCSICPRQTDA